MFDWLEDIIDDIGDGIGDAVEWVNDQVDTYIYDSGEDEAWLEEWANNVVDKYIYDADDDQGVLEKLIDDLLDDKDKEVKEPIDDAYVDIDDGFRDDVNDADNDNKDIWQTILDWLSRTGETVSGANATAKEWLPDPMAWLAGPIGAILSILTRNSTIDADTFVESGLALYRLQKELALKITELEKEASK